MKINNGYACNPYLPGKEYVPDGEPYIFNDRIYVFGSHDEFGGSDYCTGSYVGWSAPINDLGNWTYEGVILEKGQDPMDSDGTKLYFAPDVAIGPDGRYYLYYSIEGSMVISVAVCDEPAGKYKFYGHVKDKDGHVLGSSEGDDFQFDPAVLVDDDGKIYLYSGQGMPVPEIGGRKVAGSLVCELEKDMLTAKTKQKPITSAALNCFMENPFFEAQSIRKYEDKYYFTYSPIPNVHNLCYAVSDFPDRDFKYQGVLVSNANIFSDRPDVQKPQNYWGNNHGGMLKMGEEFYIFYHRHTNKSGWCRQGCVEKLTRTKEGKFLQSELTSTGLRTEPFPAIGEYGAYIACLLQKKEMPDFLPFQFYEFTDDDLYITQDETAETPYIANVKDGSKVGYKYFSFSGEEKTFFIKARGNVNGKVVVTKGDGTVLSEILVIPSSDWTKRSGMFNTTVGVDEVYMTYYGIGAINLLSFGFQ